MNHQCHQCQQCGSDTDTPGLCVVCLEMEARTQPPNPFIDAIADYVIAIDRATYNKLLALKGWWERDQ